MSDSTVTIFFEGRAVAARAGTSVAAALWEHGVAALSHSPKYGRPRGVKCARGHCMNCLMRIDGVPNVRACLTPVADGMRVGRQDSGAPYGAPMQKVLDKGGHLFPVGFYYKWFTKPSALSRMFMSGLRPLTGVGRLPEPAAWADHGDTPPARDLGHIETLVIGAGIAGMGEALAADGEVMLVDDSLRCGGQRRAAFDLVTESAADVLNGLEHLAALRARLENLAARVEAEPRIEVRTGTTVVGAWQPDMLLLEDGDGLAVVRARHICWAAGALDAAPLFDDNDRPGLIGPRALYRLLARDGLDLAGRATLVAGRGFDAVLSAALLHTAGAKVTVALEPGRTGDPALLATANRLGWSLHTGQTIAAAHAKNDRLASVSLASTDGGTTEVPCDLAVIATRAKPAYDLAYQLGVDMVLDPEHGGYVPRGADRGRLETTTPAGVGLIVAGEAAGLSPEALLEEVSA